MIQKYSLKDFLTNEILTPHGDLLLTDFRPEGLLLVNENECIYIVDEYKTLWELEPYEYIVNYFNS